MAEASSAPAEEIPKTKEKLEELTKAAALQYSLKNFSGAADHYADAVEIQAALNGEMAPENAELLFYYGRALYKVAISKSDVLGNKVAQEEKKKPKAGKKAKKQGAPTNGTIPEEPEENDNSAESKPYFQLTGTENWTDSEEEEEDTEVGEGEVAEEEQDDFQDAYEIFELSRVLYSKQLEAQEAGGSAGKGKGKGKAELSPPIRAIKEKLADCHGFLVEISLENERFHDAVADARQSLAFQEELNSFDHENVMEAHYSLSLALEFASNRVSEGQDGEVKKPANGEAPEEQSIDYELRKEAARHTELTIRSLEARIKREEAGLAGDTLTAEQKKEKKAIIKDKKEILEDMKTRVSYDQAGVIGT
jgi:HAT1-interacting factor 1